MKIGNVVKTAGIDRAIVTAILEDTFQIDNDPDWIPVADAEIIGDATPQDWIGLIMAKQVEIKRLDNKLGELIMKQGKHESTVRDLQDKIAAQDRAILTAEDRGRKASESRIAELERRILSLEKTLKEAADANNQARTKLAAYENQIKPGDPDIKILTFWDDPVYRESTLQVERHLSEGARLLDVTIAPITSEIDGHPVSRLCRVFTLQKRLQKPQPVSQPSQVAILTSDYVSENLPITQHIREHGADDALDLMDAVAAQKIKKVIAQTLEDSAALLTPRPLLSSPIQ